MRYCKKFKPGTLQIDAHHRRPGGDCRTCAYFSMDNCGLHGMVEQDGMFTFD